MRVSIEFMAVNGGHLTGFAFPSIGCGHTGIASTVLLAYGRKPRTRSILLTSLWCSTTRVIRGVAVGTIKNRVNRARTRLAELLACAA
jgi:hypothetical protein